MKNRIKYSVLQLFVVPLIFATAVSSCQKISEIESGNQLNFKVSAEAIDTPDQTKSAVAFYDKSGGAVLNLIHSEENTCLGGMTKAVQINGAKENLFYNNGFVIYGFNASGTKVLDGVNVSLTSGSGTDDAKGTPATSYIWDDGTTMSFVGYYPKTATIFSAATASSAWNFSYSVPTDADDQQDLMLSYYSGAGVNGAAELNFTHPLTSVKFKIGSVESALGEISSITIKNVYAQGVCTATPNTSEHTFTYSWTASGNTNVTGTGEGSITGGATLGNEFTFILIPQNFSTQPAVVEMVFSNGTECSTSLSSGEWKAGKTNLYTISTDGGFVYYLEQADDVTTEYEGGTDAVSITSYKTDDGGKTKIPVSWAVRYSEDGGSSWSDSAPSWLTHTIPSSSGISTVTTLESTLMPRILDSRAQAKQDAINAKKTDGNWQSSATDRLDLSRGGETANCYVVNATGYFKIPLIYGNARNSSGGQNNNAFDPQGQFRDHLLNYRGHNITNMWIRDDDGGIQPRDAVLVWEDQKGLISNVHLNDNYLEFDVLDDNAIQGNAVVAVRDDNGEIIWSWHIWVTDYEPGTDNSIYSRGEYTYTYLGREIGWCDPMTVSFGTAPRSCLIQVYQDCDSGTLMQFTYTQNNKVFENSHYCSMYEHGRKDPEYGVFEDGNGQLVAKPEFVDFPEYAYRVVISKASLAESIKNPNAHYCLSNEGFGYWTKDYDYQNLWDPNLKTVYDPSPVGYRVPPGDSFKYMIDMDCQTRTNPNGYCIQDNTGQYTIFFLAPGMIHWTLGTPADKGSASHWGAGIYSDSSSTRGCLGFVVYYNGSRLCQGWTSGPAGYPVKPIAGN